MQLKRILSIGLILCGTIAAQLNPTQLQYLATRKTNIAAIYANITAPTVSFPKPAFGMQFLPFNSVYCGTAQSSGGQCAFTLAQMKNTLDTISTVCGTSCVIEINISPYPWIANTTFSTSARARFASMFNPTTGYMHATYPNMKMTINPGFIGESPTLIATACGLLTGGGYTSFTNITAIDDCMNQAPVSGGAWLGGLSPFQYLATTYGGTQLKRFALHEPVATNANYGFLSGSTGTPTMWATWLGNTYTQVHAGSSGTKVGYAMARFDGAFNAAMSAVANMSFMGCDNYTDDLSNTTNGMGAFVAMIATAQAVSTGALEIFVSEMGINLWVKTGLIVTDANAYEGAGNCDYYQWDIFRQEVTAFALWFVAQGATEIQLPFIGTDYITVCAFSQPGAGGDSTTSTAYVALVTAGATTSPTQTTNAATWLTKLTNWPFGSYTSGVPPQL